MLEKKQQKTEVIEAMMGNIGNALRGKLDSRSSKELLIGLLAAGGVAAALSTEPALLASAIGLLQAIKINDRNSSKKARRALQYSRDRGYITVEKSGTDVTVRMTRKGAVFAKRHTLRLLPKTLTKPKLWDAQWRLIAFDIAADQRNMRNAFRTLIKRIGAIQLQKSVWVYPFDCGEQMHLFRKFFNLGEHELRLIVASSIGEDVTLRKHFKL